MTDKTENLKQIDSLDFRSSKKQLIVSYFLRAVGVVVFGYIFFLITRFSPNNSDLILRDLINIEIKSFPAIFSIMLIILDVVFVLFLHELIHSSVVLLTHKQKPNIGIRGLIIY